MKKFMSSLVVLSALAIAPALHATPITGQFSVTGASVEDTGTSLVFNPNTLNVGAANTLTGTFSTILTAGEAGQITSPINYTPYTPGSSSLEFGSGADLVSFVLDSMTCTHDQGVGICRGSGLISATGFDDTMASLVFTTQASGPVTFSATAMTPAVPEPSTLMLLGTGLIGAAGALRRRLA